MASLGKPRIPIKASDLKQAVLKKNKKLESRNKALESNLKDKEKELKSLDKECSSESKKMGKLLKDITFQEDRFQKLKGGIYSKNISTTRNMNKGDLKKILNELTIKYINTI